MAPTATPTRLSERAHSIALSTLDAKQLWSNTTPRALRDAWKKQDATARWSELQSLLAARAAESAPAGGRKKRAADPLLWGLRGPEAEKLSAWIGRLDSSGLDHTAQEWSVATRERASSPQLGLEAIAVATRIGELAARSDADAWWSVLETLVALASESLESGAVDTTDQELVVAHQLLAGELPLVLGSALPELKPLKLLAEGAREALSDALVRLTDGEGLLAAKYWTRGPQHGASLLSASWTRCLDAAPGKPPWTAEAHSQYEWLVRQNLRLANREGGLAFAPRDVIGQRELLTRMLEHGGDASDRAAAAARVKGVRADDSYSPPACSNYSEWAELGVLACGWKSKAPRMVVAHPRDEMRLTVHTGKHTLLAGAWPLDASINGQAVSATDSWDCQCWHSEPDCDFLELALPLADGARLERQMFIARQDGVALLSETLFTENQNAVDLRITSRIPLDEAIALRPEPDTRDASLTAEGDTVAGLLPLSLAEWRDDPNGGELTAEDRHLVLTRERSGKNLSSVLWIDFSPRRFKKQRTWRRLTVAEALQKVSPDVAVGYRAHCGSHQWLIYRSLAAPGNRTVLGQNLASEQLLARFRTDGTTDEYLEIEGPAS